MKFVRNLFLLCCLAAAQVISASEESALAFPETRFVIHGPHGTSTKGLVLKNHSMPVDTTPPRYQSALEYGQGTSSAGGVSWRHVARTEAGDIYLVTFTYPGREPEAKALLFDGRTDAVAANNGWQIKFTTEKERPRRS